MVLKRAWQILKGGYYTAKISCRAGAAMAHGVAGSVRDAAHLGEAILKGDLEQACDVAVQRARKVGLGVCAVAGSAAHVADQAYECWCSGGAKRFMDKATENSLVCLAACAAAGAAAAAILDVSDACTAHLVPGGLISDVDLDCIDNGVFTGNEADLQELIRAGEIEGTEHTEVDDVERDPAAKTAFLREHGFDRVPEGYEVHHIVPLCQGGADTPENMVLVTVQQHDVISGAHASFYGWHAK